MIDLEKNFGISVYQVDMPVMFEMFCMSRQCSGTLTWLVSEKFKNRGSDLQNLLEKQRQKGLTVLQYAVAHTSVTDKMITDILASVPNPKALIDQRCEDGSNSTAFLLACQKYRNLRLVECFLKHGADHTVVNWKNMNAMDCVRANSHLYGEGPAVIKLLELHSILSSVSNRLRK
jgi:hypothetical protein